MKNYDANSINNLSGVEQMRLRPGMWIGAVSKEGVLHLLNEIIDNSIDEYLAGYGSLIEIFLESTKKGQKITVKDQGRGIPFGKNDKVDEVFTSIFTDLFAGGKFSGDSYGNSSGLNGVGIKAVNALSSYTYAESKRDGKLVSQEFCQGVPKTKLSISPNTSKETGTTITFIPDNEIFNAAEVEKEDLITRASFLASLVPGVRVKAYYNYEEICDHQEKEELELIYEKNSFEGEKLFEFSLFKEKTRLRLCYRASNQYSLKSFCNTVDTRDGGSHEDAVLRALQASIKKHTGRSISRSQVQSGLCLVVSVFKKNPVYRGQNKTKIHDDEVSSFVYEDVYSPIYEAMGKNKKFLKYINDLISSQEKLLDDIATKEALSSLKEDSKNNILPEKLKPVFNCKPEKRELWIVEGDSAGGSTKEAADPEMQEVLPLRGKILNITKAELHKALQNKEVKSIFLSVGGMEGTNTPLRTHNVFFMPDSDPDGAHIISLGICLFVLVFPSFVKKHNFYIAEPPLFTAFHKDKKAYGHTAASAARAFKKLYNSDKCQISRNKGLGEMDAEELAPFMNPKTRKVTKVLINNNTIEKIKSLMGNDSNLRKALLLEIEEILAEEEYDD